MRVLLQRVKRAQVTSDGELLGAIDQGYLLFVGIHDEDSDMDLEYLVNKISNLRVFEDENGKMNLSIRDVQGAVLSVSQFTLYASVRKGNRPSFSAAGAPAFAAMMYDRFNAALRQAGLPVATGRFGADMQVELVNHGPVTLWFDTHDI